MAVIKIDDISYSVNNGQNLLEVCLSHGLNLPYFCWHPAMGSVGACRQCAAVQFADDQDQHGRLVTACMTPVADGQRFSLQAPKAVQLRESVIECLMTNHPHDCPVCEEGGECHLQDMTEMSGHTLRRYRGKKRTHLNQYLGPLINHEMNRCISCYRCVRFYQDYAGGKDLAAFACHNHIYFGRDSDGVLENEFAGNLVEVCPTGVFTDKPFSKHYTRKWDLQTAPSVCPHCAVGCNTTPGARYGTVRRVVNRYHSQINGYFLCDRGRFGYAYNNHPERVAQSTIKRPAGRHFESGNSSQDSVDKKTVTAVDLLTQVAELVSAGEAVMLGVGSARASLENNFALREFVGASQFYAGVPLADYESQRLLIEQLVAGSLDIASVKDIEQADAIVILGEDICDSAPRIALAVRQALRNKSIQASTRVQIQTWQDAAVRSYGAGQLTPLFVATLCSTRLDDVCQQSIKTDPQMIARLGYYIASQLVDQTTERELDGAQQHWADSVVEVLADAKRPLIISGAGLQQTELIKASMTLYSACKQRQAATQFYYVLPEVNSLGLALLVPGQTLGHATPGNAVQTQNGCRALQDVIDTLHGAKQQHKHRVLIVLENDLYRSMSKVSVDAMLKEVDELIVLDHSRTDTVCKANSVLAVTSVLESQGSLVNSEGRAQRFYSVNVPGAGVEPAWHYFRDAASRLTRRGEQRAQSHWDLLGSWQRCDDLSNAMANTIDTLSLLSELAVDDPTPLARQSHRFSGRTAMDANISVVEKTIAEDMDSPFVYSMEGKAAHGALENSAWSPGWNSNQSIHKFQQQVAAALAGGESGVRLFGFAAGTQPISYQCSAEVANHTGSSMTLYPLQHVFGSDELSMKSEAIAELAVAPCIVINAKEARKRRVQEWDTVRCDTQHWTGKLYVRLDDCVPDALAGVLTTGLCCISDHWPVAAMITKEQAVLPKPAQIIATDNGENSHAC